MKKTALYLAFSYDHPIEDAIRRFEERMGYPPAEVCPDVGAGLKLIRVGPVVDLEGVSAETVSSEMVSSEVNESTQLEMF